MSIVVTGATGFLGFALCKRLQALGYRVIGLGRNANIGEQLFQCGVQFHQCDINDYEKLCGLVETKEHHRSLCRTK